MTKRTQEIVDQVKTFSQAQAVIASLLEGFSSDVAFERLTSEATYAHQSVGEIANRSATNLLTSFVTRKPGGYVDDTLV